MFNKKLLIVSFVSFFACSKVAIEDKDHEKQEKMNTNDDEIPSVPFFELAKGDSVEKNVYRLKPLMNDTSITVLFSSQQSGSSLKMYGDTYGTAGDYIQDITAMTRKNNNAPSSYKGYTKVPVDLNEGAGGYYINLFFKKTSIRKDALSLIWVQASSGRLYRKDCFEDVVLGNDLEGRAWLDLNDRAGGYYIYLSGNLVGSSNTRNPIRDFAVVTTDDSQWINSDACINSGWLFNGIDLNYKAGGKYIYIGYKY